jgi:hypothetical protein
MKLYWRIKKDGKWTWVAAPTYELDTGMYTVTVCQRVPHDLDDAEAYYPRWEDEE